MRCVKLPQLGFAGAASQDGHMIYVGVLRHRIERVLSAAGLKFMPDMVFPQPHQVGVALFLCLLAHGFSPLNAWR